MTRGIGRLQSRGDPYKKKIGDHWFSLDITVVTKEEAIKNKEFLKTKGVKYVRTLKSGNHYAIYVR
jgi:hypothetical protein